MVSKLSQESQGSSLAGFLLGHLQGEDYVVESFYLPKRAKAIGEKPVSLKSFREAKRDGVCDGVGIIGLLVYHSTASPIPAEYIQHSRELLASQGCPDLLVTVDTYGRVEFDT